MSVAATLINTRTLHGFAVIALTAWMSVKACEDEHGTETRHCTQYRCVNVIFGFIPLYWVSGWTLGSAWSIDQSLHL